MKTRKEFIDQCATAVVELFTDGIADPSAKQITERVYGEDQYISPSMVEDVRKKLNAIRKVLIEDGYSTCPLSGIYYRSFRGPKRRPKTRDEARRCLAGKQEGLLGLSINPDLDIIWQEQRSWQANSGASKIGRALQDVRTAVDDGKLREENGNQIASEAYNLARFPKASEAIQAEASPATAIAVVGAEA
jgi:hypothetical protein